MLTTRHLHTHSHACVTARPSCSSSGTSTKCRIFSLRSPREVTALQAGTFPVIELRGTPIPHPYKVRSLTTPPPIPRYSAHDSRHAQSIVSATGLRATARSGTLSEDLPQIYRPNPHTEASLLREKSSSWDCSLRQEELRTSFETLSSLFL